MPRPSKFATAEEAQAARRERNRINMANKRAGDTTKGPEPRWIAYAPTPSDVPTITPPNLELRSNLVGNPQQIPTPPCTQSQDVPPLVLQPPAFHLRDEEDNVRAEQNNATEPDDTWIDDDIDKEVENTQDDIPEEETNNPVLIDDLDEDFLDSVAPPGLEDLDYMVVEYRDRNIVEHLARQLRRFGGCPEAFHATKRRLHILEHEEETQHPDCHSLSQITEILKGTFNTTTPPLPDVLHHAAGTRAPWHGPAHGV
jgi:hypothetical protein